MNEGDSDNTSEIKDKGGHVVILINLRHIVLCSRSDTKAMLYFKQFLLLLLCLVGALQGNIEPQKNSSDLNEGLISAVLKYLREHNSFYSYKSGSVVQSFLKDDKLELTTDIETSCDYPCIGGIIRCDSILRKSSDGSIWNVAGMVCAPQEPAFENIKEAEPIQKHIVKEVKKVNPDPVEYERPMPCLGCPLEIDPQTEGVNKLVSAALRHVESEHNEKHVLLRILRVQQQIVAGIKYNLLVEIAPTICQKDVQLLSCPLDENKASQICEVEYWEKPWEHSSIIIKNNCTTSQFFKLEEPINTTKKPVLREIEPSFLTELESQIIPEQEFKQAKQSISTNEIPQEASVNYYNLDVPEVPEVIMPSYRRFERNAKKDDSSSSSSSSSSSDEDNKREKKKREDHDEYKRHNERSSSSSSSSDEDNKREKKNREDHDEYKRQTERSSSSSSSSSSDEDNKREKKNQEQKHQNDSSSSSSSSESRSSEKRIKNKHNKEVPDNFVSIKKRSIENSIDETDQQVVDKLSRLAQKHLGSHNFDVIGSSKVVLDTTHYKLNFLVEKDGDIDECSVFMTLKDDISTSTVDKVVCGKDRVKREEITGGISDISKDNAQLKGFLKDGLFHLDSKSTHKNRYKIKDILSASVQVVSGSLWRVKAKVVLSDCEKNKDVDLETCGENEDPHTQICHFKIWNQPWLDNGRQTNISCETGEYSFRARRSVDYDEDAISYFLFNHFLVKYQKQYKSMDEYLQRLKIYKTNLRRIDLLNKYEKGTATYRENKFADLTHKEFSQLHGLRLDLQNENEIPFSEAQIPDIELPTSFDWRDKNAVTEVKDQGGCGSCWAFSTTGNIEGQYAIKYKELKEFSEQELVDCDKLDDGCNGGLMDNAYRSIERLGGLELENAYPYDGEDEKCHFNKTKVVVQLSGALNISHNETDMAKWLTQNGPISIAINANAMQFYAGGVSHPWKSLCNPNNLDHGVLIVGYGVHTYPMFKKSLPFWIVKNSWGKTWGEQGYYRVFRGDGTCGLNETPSSAVVV